MRRWPSPSRAARRSHWPPRGRRGASRAPAPTCGTHGAHRVSSAPREGARCGSPVHCVCVLRAGAHIRSNRALRSSDQRRGSVGRKPFSQTSCARKETRAVCRLCVSHLFSQTSCEDGQGRGWRELSAVYSHLVVLGSTTRAGERELCVSHLRDALHRLGAHLVSAAAGEQLVRQDGEGEDVHLVWNRGVEQR